ncbi:hypothetical protein [Pedobacter nutrimenti]|uniref:hypothetical protein n=1 Tax=Pedobacter nutrimenti TaxID=1241337 RepID=UPI002931B017|nr:hypothetical protein [Pedobacter nutrimenti]
MKKMILLLLLIMVTTGTQAQTFSEWFRQKKTQKKYLIEQIAALQVYIGYVKTGYDIGKKGLTLIGDIKNGDFNLHKGYFQSLVNVNPEIKKYSRVAEVMALQQRILRIQSKTRRQLRDGDLLTDKERQYCEQVFDRLLEDCGHSIDDLIQTATDGTLTLKDDERLQRIDRIYEDMLDKHAFVVQFSSSAMELVTHRNVDVREAENSLKLNGIK